MCWQYRGRFGPRSGMRTYRSLEAGVTELRFELELL